MDTFTDINWLAALNGLRDDDIRRIEEHFTVREVDARAPIFRQGEPGDSLYIIQSGRVRLYLHSETGEEFTAGIWSEGYIIGLISAFLGQSRFIAAEAVDHVELKVLQRNALHHCMETIPRFAINIANLLALLASDSIQRAAPLALESVDTKLGRVLLRLARPEVANSKSQEYIVRGITQDALASMVGASRPWVNRALADFEREGLIQRRSRSIAIPDISVCRRLWA